MVACAMSHAGHRIYVGGPLDGQIDHLVSATLSDFPLYWRFPAHGNAYYERDLNGGTEATYRFGGWL